MLRLGKNFEDVVPLMTNEWCDNAGRKVLLSDIEEDCLKELERDVVVEVEELRLCFLFHFRDLFIWRDGRDC